MTRMSLASAACPDAAFFTSRGSFFISRGPLRRTLVNDIEANRGVLTDVLSTCLGPAAAGDLRVFFAVDAASADATLCILLSIFSFTATAAGLRFFAADLRTLAAGLLASLAVLRAFSLRAFAILPGFFIAMVLKYFCRELSRSACTLGSSTPLASTGTERTVPASSAAGISA
ncbi:MAG: hypothetical protein AB7S92_23965 [Parvibaculaceae bacterium]